MEDKVQEIHDPLEEIWEERTLNLLRDSKIDQAKSERKRDKKHNLKWLVRKPMAIPEVILELQDESLRETALRCLSSFLLEKREEDPENYYRIGYMLYFSCSTMALLLQEVLAFLRLMEDDFLTLRTCKRLINVLTLFQSIAANTETREKFVDSCIPNYLIPIMLFSTSFKGFDNVRAVALSVCGILCETREPKIIEWALENKVVDTSLVVLEIGNELSQVIGMHIIEAILREDLGLSYIFSPYNEILLAKLMMTWEHLINLLASDTEFSPRLLFHIGRCYFLLCTHQRGLSIVRESLPRHILHGSFTDATEEFPVIKDLLDQLLLTVGRSEDCCLPDSLHDNMLLYWQHFD